MVEIVYADFLFIINLFADYIILFLTGIFSGCGMKYKRLILSSVIGALIGTVGLCSDNTGILSIFIIILSPPVMCFTAFGKRRWRSFGNLIFYFYFSSVILYGGMYAMASFVSLFFYGIDFSLGFILTVLFLLSVLIIYMLFSSLCRRGINQGENQVKAELFDGIRSYSLNLLVDSGNIARDPFSAKPVAIISENVLDRKLIKAVSAEFDEETTDKEYAHIKPRVIPLKTVSGTSLLYAFVPESLYISTRGEKIKADCIVAIDTNKNSFFGKDGIIPQSLLGTL